MSTRSVGAPRSKGKPSCSKEGICHYHHQRQVIIAEDSSNQYQPAQPPRLPQFDDPELIHSAKMRGFHDSLAALQLERCCICLEQFPNMSINDSGSCKCCDNDKHIPKLFSAGNNMDPALFH